MQIFAKNNSSKKVCERFNVIQYIMKLGKAKTINYFKTNGKFNRNY